ncbi:hypothetical protein [Lentzea sp. NPDC003310]|uniref:hypothetical protein n=1 Tax=Lentzea sp. NPDC003310 TaxID=3154447 RepID=UPI0033A726B3
MITRPTDNGREIPWIDDWVRPVVRLHPTPGRPGPTDSHLGGPMLWPRDEPWPTCDGSTHDGFLLTDEEVRGLVTPFAGGLQLYRRDFPELPFPDGTDLLQVFLCLIVHTDHYGPDARLVWRAAGEVTEPLAEQPAPVLTDPVYAIEPCVFVPCRRQEYPMYSELPFELLDELEFTKEPDFRGGSVDCWPGIGDYSKIGGWTRWYSSDGGWEACPDCGTKRVQLLALTSNENECDHDVGERPQLSFDGRDSAVNVFVCPADARHALLVEVQ